MPVPRFVQSILREHLRRVRWAMRCLFRFVDHKEGGLFGMVTKASEELLAAPLPELIRDLGLAVAAANAELAKVEGTELIYTVNEAEVEVNVAISVDKESTTSIAGGGQLSAFSVNASYSRTFGFKEEASSRIRLTLAAKPRGS